jgi:osmotically inducible protein OsmC
MFVSSGVLSSPGNSSMPAEKLLYTAKTHATGGRKNGGARSSDGCLDVRVSMPGRPGTGTNPEQLLAAGWSACFASARTLEACRIKIALPNDLAITAGRPEPGRRWLLRRPHLNVSLPGIEPEIATALIDGAHQMCPYSKATRGNIEVAITLI